MGSIHFIESFMFDLSSTKIPSLNQIASEQLNIKKGGFPPTWNFNDIMGTLSINFDWDDDGKKNYTYLSSFKLVGSNKTSASFDWIRSHNDIIECLHYSTFGMKVGCLQYTLKEGQIRSFVQIHVVQSFPKKEESKI